jgi:hypothetical protein
VYVASFVEAGSGSAVFNVQGLLQQVQQQHPKPLLLLTITQSPFADIYMVFTRRFGGSDPIPSIAFDYTNGSSWAALPAAAMRPLSCSPGLSVFAGDRGLPLVHSCRCPFDRQLAQQPMCRGLRKWRCRCVRIAVLFSNKFHRVMLLQYGCQRSLILLHRPCIILPL